MEEKTNDYSYYSKLLKKDFDSVAELKTAEAEFKKKELKELETKESRKAEAENVKAKIKARIEAEINAKKAKSEAYKTYLESIDLENEKVEKAVKAEREALSEFCKKHPEGFHDTIKLGDITYYYDYNDRATEHLDCFERLVKDLLF